MAHQDQGRQNETWTASSSEARCPQYLRFDRSCRRPPTRPSWCRRRQCCKPPSLASRWRNSPSRQPRSTARCKGCRTNSACTTPQIRGHVRNMLATTQQQQQTGAASHLFRRARRVAANRPGKAASHLPSSCSHPWTCSNPREVRMRTAGSQAGRCGSGQRKARRTGWNKVICKRRNERLAGVSVEIVADCIVPNDI